MRVGFSSAKLAKQCTAHAARVREFGLERALKVKLRLDQLAAAGDLREFHTLPQARCHQLTGNRDEQFSADLDGPYRLIFEVADDPVPRLTSGGIDLEAVRSVRILEITDPH